MTRNLRSIYSWRFGHYCVLLLVITMSLGLQPFASASEPMGAPISSIANSRRISLDPSSGPCTVSDPTYASPAIWVRGSGFAPGVQVNFTLTRNRDDSITAANGSSGGPPAGVDGTIVLEIPLVGCGPDEPIGSTFTIKMYEYYPNRVTTMGPGASATFTVTTSLPGLPNTGGGWASRIGVQSSWHRPHLSQ